MNIIIRDLRKNLNSLQKMWVYKPEAHDEFSDMAQHYQKKLKEITLKLIYVNRYPLSTELQSLTELEKRKKELEQMKIEKNNDINAIANQIERLLETNEINQNYRIQLNDSFLEGSRIKRKILAEKMNFLLEERMKLIEQKKETFYKMLTAYRKGNEKIQEFNKETEKISSEIEFNLKKQQKMLEKKKELISINLKIKDNIII